MSEHSTAETPAWFSPRAFAAWLALLLLLSYPDVFLGFGSFVLRDFAVFGYPLAEYHKASFWRGEFPLWNPLVYCGVPHLAQWNTLTLYPGTLIYLLLPLPVSVSLSWFCLLHLYSAGLGMYFLVRQGSGRDFPAALAGVAFAFSGLMQNCLMWPNNIAALGLMPWVVLAVMLGCAAGGRLLLMAALVGTLQMLTGAPEIIFVTWVLATGVAGAAAFVDGRWSRIFCRAPRLVGIVALVTGLASVQLLPFFDLVRHSVRITHGHETIWSAHPVFWTNMFLPMAGGQHFANGVVYLNGQDWIHSYYSGLPVLCLALLSLGTRRSLYVRGAILGLLGAMLLATGPEGCLFTWVDRVLPLDAIRFPVKFLVPVFFLLPLLAAKGAAILFTESGESSPPCGWRRTSLRCLWVFLSLFAISTVMIGTGVNEDASATGWNAFARLLWLAVSIVLVLQIRRAGGRKVAAWLQIGFLVVVWWDLKTHLPALTPRIPPQIYEVENEILADLAPRPTAGAGRLFRLPDTEMRNTAFTDEDFDMVVLRRRAEAEPMFPSAKGFAMVEGFLALWFPLYDGLRTLLTDKDGKVNEEFADFLAITHTNSPVEIGSWSPRPGAHAWVTAGMAPKYLDTREAYQRIANGWWDAEKEVFLGRTWQSKVAATNYCEAKIGNVRFENGRVRFEVESDRPTVAVVAQAYHHWWTATAGGTAVEIMPANLGFQAVPVPAGRVEVELRYVDRWFQTGAALSLVTLVLWCALWFRWCGSRASGLQSGVHSS